MRRLSQGITADHLQRFPAHLAAAGIAVAAPPEGAPTDGLWLHSPDGVPVQLRVADKCSLSQPAPRSFPPASSNAGRTPGRSRLKTVQPLYLSHSLLYTPDVDATMAFYCNAPGLRLSDCSGPGIAFLHSPHGSDHHLIALAKSDGPGLHHSR